MKKQQFLILAVLVLSLFISCSTTGPEINPVPNTVIKYLDKNGTDFVNYEVSNTGKDNDYIHHERVYTVDEELETVWQYYMDADPIRAFDSPIIDFGIVYNPEDSKVYDAGDTYLPKFSDGQIIILNLKWMGFYGVPIAFKVSKIDLEKKTIEFIYMKNNICNGFQRIYFYTDHDSEGRTVTHIDHISDFITESKIINTVLYPPFHEQTIDAFHEAVLTINGLTFKLN